MRSSDPNRPSSRRAASGAWNRLKPVREDVLESYGLPSKGETRYIAPPSSPRLRLTCQAQRLPHARNLPEPHHGALHEAMRPQPHRPGIALRSRRPQPFVYRPRLLAITA